ncbi:hypothetical protein CEXT_111521 [Caerostris extrusa]|uniref:Uncharacterized protein n=1 Tax=Caerostris extrusa TaxID=172846 RepID=A0AAV4RVC6_CAEEX|nr:hypothetical protein CEXT_111521 [Caerostris extrusa]
MSSVSSRQMHISEPPESRIDMFGRMFQSPSRHRRSSLSSRRHQKHGLVERKGEFPLNQKRISNRDNYSEHEICGYRKIPLSAKSWKYLPCRGR